MNLHLVPTDKGTFHVVAATVPDAVHKTNAYLQNLGVPYTIFTTRIKYVTTEVPADPDKDNQNKRLIL